MKSQPFPYSPVARSLCLTITFAQILFRCTECPPSYLLVFLQVLFLLLSCLDPRPVPIFQFLFFLFHSFGEVATTFSTDHLEPCLSVSLWRLLHLLCFRFYSHLVVLCRWSCKKCKYSVRYQISHLSFSFTLMDWKLRTAGRGLH